MQLQIAVRVRATTMARPIWNPRCTLAEGTSNSAATISHQFAIVIPPVVEPIAGVVGVPILHILSSWILPQRLYETAVCTSGRRAMAVETIESIMMLDCQLEVTRRR
jgi:hypothetical protein